MRVGGGFLHIDEFLNKFGSLELEKMAQNDPIKLFERSNKLDKILDERKINL